MTTENKQMFCYQCEMSALEGCGVKGQKEGTCGKPATLARLQDMMVFGLKGLPLIVNTQRNWRPIPRQSMMSSQKPSIFP